MRISAPLSISIAAFFRQQTGWGAASRSIHGFGYSSVNSEFGACRSVGFHFFGPAEGDELIGIEHYGLDDNATALSVRHLALRELLALIEARRKPLAILHNFPDAIIVLASKPRCKICHSVLLQLLKRGRSVRPREK